MKTLSIEARRTSYSLKDCGRTMTVGELINWLEGFDEDAKVYLSHDNGYTYGPIEEYDFTEWNEQDDEELPNDPLDPEAAKTAEPIEPRWTGDSLEELNNWLEELLEEIKWLEELSKEQEEQED